MEDEIKIQKINFLYKAIEDCQQTIRFVDTKAGIIFLLFGIYVSMIGTGLPDFAKYFFRMGLYLEIFFSICLFLFFCLIVLILIAIITLIFPRSNPSEHIDISGYHYKGIFYISDMDNICFIDNLKDRKNIKIQTSVEGYIEKLNKILDFKNLEKELICELLKVSYIRELKIRRMQNTKWFIAVSLILSLFLIVLHFIGISYYMPIK